MRSCGVLLHISSLPSPHGVGTLGAEACRFVDFLAEAGQSYWQVLPLSPTGCGDSPYQAVSSAAGNPYFIDLDLLCEEGLLDRGAVEAVNWGGDAARCDYGALFRYRLNILRPACDAAQQRLSGELAEFCAQSSDWLEDYALYMALKNRFKQHPWFEWDEAYMRRETQALKSAASELDGDIRFFKTLQFLFDRQWRGLREYAKARGVKIIGDIPFYVPCDSADVWANPRLFKLDDKLAPTALSGCPPDAFTEDGQLWGTPVYDWQTHKAEGYKWWIARIERQFELFDVLRIDHFRGFDSYYTVPADAENARVGVWEKGPGMDFFSVLKTRLGDAQIIAEDLGFLTPSVRRLLADSGCPGMRVLQFAFDGHGDSDYLPRSYPKNCAAYIGTHDNDTCEGWFSAAPTEDVARAYEYLGIREGEDRVGAMIDALLSSAANLTVLTMQDLLRLSSEARMNTPGTLGGNWLWRMDAGVDYAPIAAWLRAKTELFGRI